MKVSVKLNELTMKNILLVVSYTALLVLGILYFDEILGFLSTIVGIVSPFMIGFMMAFIFNIPMKFFIEKLPIKKEKTRKLVSALLSIVLVILILIVLIMIVLPQVIENVRTLINNLPRTLKQLEYWVNYLSQQIDISDDIVLRIENYLNDVAVSLPQKLTSWVPNIALKVGHFTSGIVNIFMAFIMAVYMILSKDKLLRQMNKLGRALFNDKQMDQVHEILHLTSETFENFLAGQLTESVIIGVLCYIGCVILNIPYASIAAIVIGFTNIIPYFGPIIGAFISAALILFVSPIKAVVFLIFSTLLQQFESNLIYPHVVGSSVGLSALWVLFAVTVGGGLFGIPGMIFGLPTFSVIYELVRRWTNQRLQQKTVKKTG